MESAYATLTKLFACFLEGLLSSPWEHRHNICIHLISVKNNRRLPFSFYCLFILFIWVIYEFPFVWNGGFILKLNRNFCQTLLFGADSHSCDVVLTHFKTIMFWLDRSNAVQSVRQAGGRAFKLQNLKPGVWEDCLQRVGCHRLVLCDL